MIQNPIITLAAAIQNKQPAVLATIVDVIGASPAKPGAQIVLSCDGSTTGTVGGGKLEAAIIAEAQIALHDGTAHLSHYRLTQDGPDAVGTLCGGEVDVFIQPFLPSPQLVIVGGGHIGRPLKVLGETAGFNIIVVDVVPGRADIPELASIHLTTDSYIVLITTDHISDEAAMRQVISSPAHYIGMIGSRAKCSAIFEHLKADGYPAEQLQRVYAPIGLDLGGPTPEEIAVGILAEIIAVRRGGKGSSRSR